MTELTVLSAIQSLIADENVTIFPFYHYFSCFAGSHASLSMDEVSWETRFYSKDYQDRLQDLRVLLGELPKGINRESQ
jgi:hypothetical protein